MKTLKQFFESKNLFNELKTKIETAKKGQCEEIDAELTKLHGDRKITSPEFEELEAMVGRKMKTVDEDIEGINSTEIGYLITYSMWMIAQTHVWHLLCPNGQKHTALGEFYEELQDEVDELAERFIAQGGFLRDFNEPIVASYSDQIVLERCNHFRTMVTSCIDSRSEMASIRDGVVDLQELIDSKLYKFKLQ